MNTRPYTDNIPSNISWYRDRAHWGSQSANAPSNPNAPMQFWADASMHFGNWWESYGGNDSRVYRFIARDSTGKPKLTPIGSVDFLITYSSSNAIVSTYKEFSFMFPNGVPFLEFAAVPTTQGSTVNVEGGTLPARDYPVELRTDTMFVLDAKGEVAVIHYQEFIKAARGVVQQTPEQKVAIIKSLCDSPQPATQKIQAIRVVVQEATAAKEVI